MKVPFKSLDIGDKFRFGSESSFTEECIKTGQRTYETVHEMRHYGAGGRPYLAPLRCRVGTVNVNVERIDA